MVLFVNRNYLALQFCLVLGKACLVFGKACFVFLKRVPIICKLLLLLTHVENVVV
jgi:hypothetical protein